MGRGEEVNQQVLEYIDTFYKSHGYGPSRRQIADATENSLSLVQAIIVQLADQDRIYYEEGIARSIRLKEQV